MIETIGQRLDRLYPAACYACGTPYKRMDAKWVHGMLRDVCANCGLDQTSDEAACIARAKSGLWHQCA